MKIDNSFCSLEALKLIEALLNVATDNYVILFIEVNT